MSIEYITKKLNDTHLNTSYNDNDMNMSIDPIKLDSLCKNSLHICVNIKDKYNNMIYDLKTTTPPIIYTENESLTKYNLQPCISPNPTIYVCPSPPRPNKNRSFCWSHALK